MHMNIEWESVDIFERQRGAVAAFRAARDFMIDYISLIRSALPEISLIGLAIAKQFRDGAVGSEELIHARVECWKYLKTHSADLDATTPEYCAVRAVICILYDGPVDGGDAGDLVDLFLQMANCVEDHSDSISALLDKHFPRHR